MTKRPWPATTALGVALCLGGCSGTDTPSATPPSATGTTAAPAGPVAAADVCAYLTGRLPTLRDIGSPVGVQANLAGNLQSFFEGLGQQPDGQVLEDATSSSCPAVRSEVLRLAGLGSFLEL